MDAYTAEMKSIAKAIGEGLRRQGHAVPHSAVLNALAASVNRRNWHVLKADHHKPTTSCMPEPEQVKVGIELTANLWNDDKGHVGNVRVEQLVYFSPADVLEEFLEGPVRLKDLSQPYYTARSTSFRDARDAICREAEISTATFISIEPQALLQWMGKHREDTLAQILCDKASIVLELVVTDTGSCWTWSKDGIQIHYSMASSEEDAYIEAYQTLNLLDDALARSLEKNEETGELYEVPVTFDTTMTAIVKVRATSQQEAVAAACEKAFESKHVKFELDEGNYRGKADYYCPDEDAINVVSKNDLAKG